jgi:hypothetical protein
VKHPAQFALTHPSRNFASTKSPARKKRSAVSVGILHAAHVDVFVGSKRKIEINRTDEKEAIN